jgi:hypothetical protein
MTPRRGRPSLAERAAITQRLAADAKGGRDGRPAASATGGRHCWVVDPPGVPGRWPGLLAEWRRAETGWEGLVVFVAVAGGKQALVQAWVAASCLQDAT